MFAQSLFTVGLVVAVQWECVDKWPTAGKFKLDT